MFKRVEKRRLKKQEEEELGIDEDMKEILGMHDTDSEESASDESDSDDDEEEDVRDDVAEDDDGSGEEGQSVAEDEDADEDEGEDAEDPNVTVRQALLDSVYVVSILPEVKACVVCPGKLLKGAKMVQLHRVSNAHERRSKQFKALSVDAHPDESAWEVLQRGSVEKPKLSLAPSADATSKRAEKKASQAEKLNLRREKAKAKRVKDALKKKASTAGPSGLSPEQPEVKTVKPLSESGKPSKKNRSKQNKSSEIPKVVSPPKKKRKIEQSLEINGPSAATEETPSAPPKRVKKPKHKKAEGDSPPAPASPNKDAPGAKESVKDVARSISDRAKNARQRAMTASKGSKDDSRPRRKKPVATS
ncbi:hypothetical protein HYPSUDRAFT_71036 [Hypholoma sublateritium FD-334 SS-4]|uniref:Uncharacterized protein n=1 Tax=Hypholoma sublateritium (strain FD-334 SS-4) TaxID=945553 RepID=A0A0D2M0X4_HYPSF|nr:hypothetical protein HYPSUDRAFT_71036 [Hypholoma sublateritium FD-334 SS-4]